MKRFSMRFLNIDYNVRYVIGSSPILWTIVPQTSRASSPNFLFYDRYRHVHAPNAAR